MMSLGSRSLTTWSLCCVSACVAVSAGADDRHPRKADGVFNVRDFGGTPDDGTDDREAIRAAVQAAQAVGGGTVYFPRGTYLTSHTEWKSLAQVSFRGAGRERTLIRRIGAHPMTFSFVGCRNLEFRDLALDANGCLNYGGTYFLGCKRVRITDTHYYDSNTAARQKRPSKTDIYAYVFGRGETHNEDVVIRRNLIEDLQLEVDYCRRVKITENRVRRPTNTTGIGTFSLQWDTVSGEDPCGEDILIADNVISDLRDSYTGIAVHLDPNVHKDGTPLNNITYRDIRILRNTIVYPAGSGVSSGKAIQIGATDSSQQTQAIVFDRIRIEGNRIYIHPSAGIRREPGVGEVVIFGNHLREFSGGRTSASLTPRSRTTRFARTATPRSWRFLRPGCRVRGGGQPHPALRGSATGRGATATTGCPGRSFHVYSAGACRYSRLWIGAWLTRSSARWDTAGRHPASRDVAPSG